MQPLIDALNMATEAVEKLVDDFRESQEPREKPRRRNKRAKTKWIPPLRYARSASGGLDVHSKPNRQMRRREQALLRTGFLSRDGEYIRGWRSKRKQVLRQQERAHYLDGGAAPRPVKVRA